MNCPVCGRYGEPDRATGYDVDELCPDCKTICPDCDGETFTMIEGPDDTDVELPCATCGGTGKVT